LGRFLQKGTNAGDRSGPRIPAIAKVEHETRIAHNVPAESGWGGAVLAKIFFNFFEQVH
jgi:hypothetical protein